MDELEHLAATFEEERSRLHAIARRMLGSASAADDAVQDTWLRISRSRTEPVDNFAAWSTTVLTRVCLNALRAHRTRQERTVDEADPVVVADTGIGPADDAVLAESVGTALSVVLDVLPPAERVAFVLHDMFAVPFDEIAPMLERTPAATRQLASRARRRVRGATQVGPDRARARDAVDAYVAAARAGRLDDLVRLLHPDVVLRTDWGTAPGEDGRVVRGGATIARLPHVLGDDGASTVDVRVGTRPGVVVLLHGRPFAVMGFVVEGDVIAAIEAITRPDRVARLTRHLPLTG